MMNEQEARENSSRPFWALSLVDVEALLATNSEYGVSAAEAQERLRLFGPNVIERSRRASWASILLGQFKSPLILILVLASIVTLVIAHYRDTLFILAAVVVNAALGFYQEFKAERALAELKTYLKQRSRIIRDGREFEIDSAEIVPGDCLRLNQGDRVPADARVVFVNDFQIDEAVLTGESLPVAKSPTPVAETATLGDQHSMVFAGTLVTQGVATVIVCRTGLSTELGKIAALVADAHREETPLQKKIRVFSAQAGIFLGILTVGIFIAGIALGYSSTEMFLTAVAIGVSAVPEGLPVAMTVILAVGVQRMARRKGVVRKLVAAEALGSTTVILTDKTGTLTQAHMVLKEVISLGTTKSAQILGWALLNTNVLIENPNDEPAKWRLTGRVLEMALVRSAGLQGITVAALKRHIASLRTLPFNAVNKFSVSLIREGERHQLIYVGAADILITHSTLSPIEQKAVLDQIDSLARSGALVVGVATKEVDTIEDFSFAHEKHRTGLTLEGLLTLTDPVRPGVRDAVHRIELAGIRTIIVTGDHRGTAEAIAREVGIAVTAESVIDAAELRALSDTDLAVRLKSIRVIARVTPLDKMRVVKVLQASGEVVAMTGDGVNDAPSIKRADIGIAMGSGTEVARDVADLVLLDDNFETIVAAIEEGRQIIHNIRKVLVYLLSTVADGLILIGGALATGLVLPLNALQILWVNFFSDSFPAVAFAFEKNVDGTTHHSREMKTDLFNPIMKFLILFIGVSTSALLFFLYWGLLRLGFPEDIVRTFIFASFGTYSLLVAFPLRSLDTSMFSYSPFSNLPLVFGVGAGVVLMIIAVYVPFFQSLFDTVALPFYWALAVVGVSVLNIAAVELGKWIFRLRKARLLTQPA